MKFNLSIVFLLLMNFIKAQEELSLEKAINYALEHKAEAVKAKLNYENSEYQIAQVRSAALPQINASGNLAYNPLLQEISILGKNIKMGKNWSTSAGISLHQQIFNQGVFIGLKAARTTREFYALNQQMTKENLIERVATAYYQVYQTKQKLLTIENNLNSTTKTRNVLDGLFKSGLAKKIDLDRMNVAINNLQATKQQIINALQLQEHGLKFIIGMDIDTPITMPKDTFEPKHLLSDENENIENRTEMKLIAKQIDMLNLDKKAKLAEYYPTLALTANLAYSGMGNQFPWFSKHQDTNFFSASSIGLTLNIPIFNGFATRAKVQQAEISIKKAELDQKDTALAINLDILNAKTQINNSLLTINTQKENVGLAKQVLANVQNNYRNGLANLTDLLDAEKAYTEAENNYTNALLEYKLAEIKLLKSKGNLHLLTQ
ncbi:MAG: TolC family protein [Flavobacteriaceae bacterium]|nr:TolC family protein [Flavobacteriaceae bacterium]